MDVLQNEGTTVTRRQRADQTLVDGNDAAAEIKINPEEEVLWEAAYRAWRKDLKREKRSIGVAACKIVAIFIISWFLVHWYMEPRDLFRPEETSIDPFDALRATDSRVDIIDGNFGDGTNGVVNEFDGRLEKKRREIKMRLNDLNRRAYVLEDVIGRLTSGEIGGSYEGLNRVDERSDDDGLKSWGNQ